MKKINLDRMKEYFDEFVEDLKGLTDIDMDITTKIKDLDYKGKLGYVEETFTKFLSGISDELKGYLVREENDEKKKE